MPQLKLRELGFGVGAGHKGIDRVIALCYWQQRPKLSLLLSYYRVRALGCVDSVIFDMLVISQGEVDIEQPRTRVMMQGFALKHWLIIRRGDSDSVVLFVDSKMLL